MPIKLTEAATDVIRAEAKAQLSWVIRERHTFRGEDEGDKQTVRLLQIADVLAATAEPKFSHEDGTAEVEFTEEALAWLEKAAQENRGNLEQADLCGELTADQAGADA